LLGGPRAPFGGEGRGDNGSRRSNRVRWEKKWGGGQTWSGGTRAAARGEKKGVIEASSRDGRVL